MAKETTPQPGEPKPEDAPDDTEFALEAAEPVVDGVPPGTDPFDPSMFAVSPDALTDGELGTEIVFTGISVRKPAKTEFFRAHPTLHASVAILTLDTEREDYLLTPNVAATMPGDAKPKLAQFCISRQGAPFLWLVGQPDAGGRRNEWTTSAHTIRQTAIDGWVRMTADMAQGRYTARKPNSPMPDPVWPDLTLGDIFKHAFGEERTIRTPSHPVFKRIMGFE